MGFVYQFHQLLPEFSALENVLMPQMIRGVAAPRGRGAGAASCWACWGSASGSTTARPSSRAASSSAPPSPARSPTRPGSCWPTSPPATSIPSTSAHVFHELLELIQHTGVAALIATHNLALAKRMHRVLRLERGLLIETNPASVG